MQENYLAKWLNGELTPSELEEFKNSDQYATYVRILEASENLEGPDFDSDKALEAINNRKTLTEPRVVRLNPFKNFLRVAAVAAIIMFGAFLYLKTLDTTIDTGFAQNKELVLPDESIVILNADSHISYSESNWKDNRKIDLKGEAFFKVAKGQKFTVNTKAGDVSVLGTQFNVIQRDGVFEVTCYEGMVNVNFKKVEKNLSAGDSFKVLEGQIVETGNTITQKPSWLNDESTFNSVPLKYVLAEFERQYNIEIEVNNIDTDQLFTGTFTHTDKDLALKSISVPSQIKFKLEGGKVLFYGE
ncbi:FecR family protein [Euzebyella marina]|uniref:FecR family protein n=1 Tax=Euzebyella marina TaxID=1761453 RepID=A0A3G2L9M6_9FLAO|nr:FecR domain-containing protein [Euzebyella marina]AYN68956.1 FecR family protein [Euzebyella marina]